MGGYGFGATTLIRPGRMSAARNGPNRRHHIVRTVDTLIVTVAALEMAAALSFTV
jgi:hypothetical protein